MWHPRLWRCVCQRLCNTRLITDTPLESITEGSTFVVYKSKQRLKQRQGCIPSMLLFHFSQSTVKRAIGLVPFVLSGLVVVRVSSRMPEPSVAERCTYASAVRCVLHRWPPPDTHTAHQAPCAKPSPVRRDRWGRRPRARLAHGRVAFVCTRSAHRRCPARRSGSPRSAIPAEPCTADCVDVVDVMQANNCLLTHTSGWYTVFWSYGWSVCCVRRFWQCFSASFGSWCVATSATGPDVPSATRLKSHRSLDTQRVARTWWLDDALWIRDGVQHNQRRPVAPTEQYHPLPPEMLAKELHIPNRVHRRVLSAFGKRSGLPTASLVKEDDVMLL